MGAGADRASGAGAARCRLFQKYKPPPAIPTTMARSQMTQTVREDFRDSVGPRCGEVD